MACASLSVSRALTTAFAAGASVRGLDAIAGHWRMLVKNLFDPYRPELHYMRGPGPKWREKHRMPRHTATQHDGVTTT
jgi:hypothetical protein